MAEDPARRSPLMNIEDAPVRPAPARRAREVWRRRCCYPCRRGLDMLDQMIISWIQRRDMPDPLPPEVTRVARRLRCPASTVMVLLGLWIVAQSCVVARGWLLLSQGIPKSCKSLQTWLIGYCTAITTLPLFFAMVSPLVVWWALTGTMERDGLPDTCRKQDPALWNFVDVVLISSIVTMGGTFVEIALVYVIQLRIERLHRLWGSAGPAPEELIRYLLSQPRPTTDSETECAICLDAGSNDGGSQPAWVGLPCGHRFHQRCLVQWLQRARRCPLCRLDVQRAYLESTRGGSNPGAAAPGGAESASPNETATQDQPTEDV